ncbi:hypothetical protein CF319_g8481 [Tilletia indica]|nr:hypothetical protein CF319_g8481 [Tilletia indica]
MSREDPPARNTRAATAAATAADPSSATASPPWTQDIQAAMDALRSDVDARFGSISQRLEDNAGQLGAVRTDMALQYQNLVDLIKNPTSATAAPATTMSPSGTVLPAPSPVPACTTAPALVIPAASTTSPADAPTPQADTAPWSRGPAYKSLPSDDIVVQSTPSGQGLHITAEPASSSPTRGEPISVSFTPSGLSKGYNIKTSDIGTFDGTPEDLELFLARVQALNDSESDINWKQAMLRAMPLLMRGYAASWYQTLEPSKRLSLTSLASWFRELREAFSPDPNYMRRLARARAWKPDQEDIVGYVFDKTALIKAAFPGVPDSEVIYDIVDRLPTEIRKLLRTPLQPQGSLVDLRNELRMQEQFWRADTGRALIKPETSTTVATSKPPKYSSFAGPVQVLAPEPVRQQSSTTSTARRPPPTSPLASRRPPGKSISEDFDGSRLDYGIEPESKKRMMRYRIPGTDRVMWCQRPCRRCGADHFDFAHDYCASHPIASVNTAAADDLDSFDYLVTMEEDNDSSDF